MSFKAKHIILVASALLLLSRRNAAIGKLYDFNSTPGGRVDRENTGDDYARQLLGRDEYSDNFLFSPEKATKQFNLSGVEFGNWMNQEDRLSHHIAAMHSLKDLAKCLGIPMSKIGFGKRLSIALGARGRGNAAAHYEPMSRWTINLTKTQGDGALAHEYGHCIDNYLSFRFLGSNDFASGGRSTRMRIDDKLLAQNNLRGHFENIMDLLYYKDNGELTSYALWQKNEGTNYYRMRTEVFARTFEQYIRIKMKEKGIKNNYLVEPTPARSEPPQALVKKAMPYIDKVVKMAFK